MITLPPERVGPYVRALSAAIRALAPGEEHVPMSRALGHLGALDPAHGGALLDPPELAGATGMPSYAWLERARSEAELARADPREGPSEVQLARIQELDPALAGRMRDRRELHRYLRGAELLATTQLGGAVRWYGPTESNVGIAYDRIAPDGRWVRIRVDLVVRGGVTEAMRVDRTGRLQIDDSVRHLFTRHFAVALPALRIQLEQATDSQVVRLARATVGPFWFPGVPLPAGVPEGLGQGLLLHASTDVIDRALPESRALYPLEPLDAGEGAFVDPDAWPVFRERRFAAGGRALPAITAWADTLGTRLHVVPIQAGGGGRRL
ncbi:MAG: hypothetical protein R3F59_16195 [Myxococcota bacterium]